MRAIEVQNKYKIKIEWKMEKIITIYIYIKRERERKENINNFEKEIKLINCILIELHLNLHSFF